MYITICSSIFFFLLMYYWCLPFLHDVSRFHKMILLELLSMNFHLSGVLTVISYPRDGLEAITTQSRLNLKGLIPMNNADFMESKPHYWTRSKRARPLKPNCVGFKPGKRRWQLLGCKRREKSRWSGETARLKSPPPPLSPPTPVEDNVNRSFPGMVKVDGRADVSRRGRCLRRRTSEKMLNPDCRFAVSNDLAWR